MTDIKACPLFLIKPENGTADCIEENCHWWINEGPMCTLKALPYIMSSLHEQIKKFTERIEYAQIELGFKTE